MHFAAGYSMSIFPKPNVRCASSFSATGAIHTRLSGKRITGTEEIVEAAVRSGGVTVFPGWEFYAPVAGSDRSVFDLLPHPAVLLDEPDLLRTEFDRFWSRVTEAHERSGVGNLVRPEDL